jgi:hypothetical protein
MINPGLHPIGETRQLRTARCLDLGTSLGILVLPARDFRALAPLVGRMEASCLVRVAGLADGPVGSTLLALLRVLLAQLPGTWQAATLLPNTQNCEDMADVEFSWRDHS